MSSARSIVLTGFMGTGKSTTALVLSDMLDWVLVDMDTVIEQRTGWTIPRMFAERGEPFFRTLEHAMCLELSLRESLVISTGGGALINPESRAVLTERALVVCLQARPETIESRLAAADNRPLASHWRSLHQQRSAIYAALPHQVWTDDKTPTQVAEEVKALWNVYR